MYVNYSGRKKEEGRVNVQERLARLQAETGYNAHRDRLMADLGLYPAGMTVRTEVDELNPREPVRIEERGEQGSSDNYLLLGRPDLRVWAR